MLDLIHHDHWHNNQQKERRINMSKKLLAGLLAGAMAVSVIPQIALAEDEVKVEEPKYYLTDLTNYYEKDTFYHDGEELDEELIWRNDII